MPLDFLFRIRKFISLVGKGGSVGILVGTIES